MNCAVLWHRRRHRYRAVWWWWSRYTRFISFAHEYASVDEASRNATPDEIVEDYHGMPE